MRISFALTYENPVINIFSKQKDLRHLQDAISQGKGLLDPSDNPLNWAGAMNLKTAVAKAEQWKKNIDFGTNWNNTTEGYLSHLDDLLTRAREIAIKAIKINSSETTASYVKELDQIIREAITVANAKYQDRYIFSPNTDPTNPLFGFTESNGEITSITDPANPGQMSESLDIAVGENTSVRVNVDGERLFFDDQNNSILRNLLDLKNAVKLGDTNQISNAMGKIENDQSRVLEALTTVGGTLNRLEARGNALDTIMISQQERIGDLEETDMAKLITDYQLTATALQAIYQSTARVTGLSLLQYL
jgi:flagellar hook-associated protein 3 FlgL